SSATDSMSRMCLRAPPQAPIQTPLHCRCSAVAGAASATVASAGSGTPSARRSSARTGDACITSASTAKNSRLCNIEPALHRHDDDECDGKTRRFVLLISHASLSRKQREVWLNRAIPQMSHNLEDSVMASDELF